MKVTLKDGSSKEYSQAMSIIDIAKDISEGLARVACVAELDGEVVDLRTIVDGEHTLNILTFDSDEGKAAFRHTASHVLAQAIKRLYPDAKCAIGPSIEEGFYYDFDIAPLDREALDKIEKEMKKIVKEGATLERFTLPRQEAIDLMKKREEPYKVELIEDLPEDAEISFYQQGEYIDLCAGPHLMNTKPLKAMKLISSSGAYWRGNEKNKMLTRVYGTAYTKKADLDAYLEHLEDIKKRDHNKLGRELELFTTVDVIGQGLPLLMPKGVQVIQTLQRWIEDDVVGQLVGGADWPVLCFVLVGNRGGNLQLGHFFHHFFSIRLHGCHIVLFDFRFFDHCFGGSRHLYILFVERETDAVWWQASLVVASHKFHFTFGFELGRVSHFELLGERNGPRIPTQVHGEQFVVYGGRFDR